MIPYYFLIALPFLMSVIQFESEARQLIRKKKNYPVLIFFGFYFVLMALRHVQVGNDTNIYASIYQQISVTAWGDLSNVRDSEYGYTILNKLVAICFGHFQVFLGIAAAISVIPLAKLYFDESENSMLSIVLFLNFPVFAMNFSGLRQGIAISIGAIAFYAVKKKKLIPFILLVLLAMSFHMSAFILFLMYPLYYIRIRGVHLPLLVPLGVIVYLLNEQIYRFVLPLLGEKYAEHYDQITETGSYTMIVLFVLFLAYSFLAPSKEMMDETTLGLRNFLLLVLFIQLFAPISTIAMRMNYYYIIFVPLLIPRITARWKSVDPFITKVVNIVMIVFFTGYFLYTAHNDNSLSIYPYFPFWQQPVLP